MQHNINLYTQFPLRYIFEWVGTTGKVFMTCYFLSSETDFLIFMKDPLYVIENVSIHRKICAVDGEGLGVMKITEARIMIPKIIA